MEKSTKNNDELNVESKDFIKKIDHNRLCLIEFTYKCGECMSSFKILEDLQKHILDNHEFKDETDQTCVIKTELVTDYDEFERWPEPPDTDKQKHDNAMVDKTEENEIAFNEYNGDYEESESDLVLTESDKNSYLCFVCGIIEESAEKVNEHFLKYHKEHNFSVDQDQVSYGSAEMPEDERKGPDTMMVNANEFMTETYSGMNVCVSNIDEVDGEIKKIDVEAEKHNKADNALSNEVKKCDQQMMAKLTKKVFILFFTLINKKI